MKRPYPEVKTNYSEAWVHFTFTNDYKRVKFALEAYGWDQPYINNLLEIAFSAGFNSTGTEITIIEQTPAP